MPVQHLSKGPEPVQQVSPLPLHGTVVAVVVVTVVVVVVVVVVEVVVEVEQTPLIQLRPVLQYPLNSLASVSPHWAPSARSNLIQKPSVLEGGWPQ